MILQQYGVAHKETPSHSEGVITGTSPASRVVHVHCVCDALPEASPDKATELSPCACCAETLPEPAPLVIVAGGAAGGAVLDEGVFAGALVVVDPDPAVGTADAAPVEDTWLAALVIAPDREAIADWARLLD